MTEFEKKFPDNDIMRVSKGRRTDSKTKFLKKRKNVYRQWVPQFKAVAFKAKLDLTPVSAKS